MEKVLFLQKRESVFWLQLRNWIIIPTLWRAAWQVVRLVLLVLCLIPDKAQSPYVRIFLQCDKHKEHTANCSLCAPYRFFVLVRFRQTWSKPISLSSFSSTPFQTPKWGGDSGHLALFFTHYFTLFSSIMEFHPYFTHKKMDQIRSE